MSRTPAHGFHAHEQRIMDLHDQGYTPGQIVLATGLVRATVANVVSKYRHARSDDAWVSRARAASQALADACAASGGRFV